MRAIDWNRYRNIKEQLARDLLISLSSLEEGEVFTSKTFSDITLEWVGGMPCMHLPSKNSFLADHYVYTSHEKFIHELMETFSEVKLTVISSELREHLANKKLRGDL